MKTDLIIIGSGPGGYRAAEYAAKNGLHTVVIEEAQAGGTCLNRGCIPTKTICHEADVFETAKSYIPDSDSHTLKADYEKIYNRKEEVVGLLRSGVEQLMSAPGITFVRGKARLTGPRTVAVGNDEYQADHIIIASGSEPHMPPIPGVYNEGVVTSDRLLDMRHLPQHLCIVGAGVIGMEFASALHTLGCKVTVIEFLKECLPALDSDIAKRLRKQMEKRGVCFEMQASVERIEKTAEGLKVTFSKKNKEQYVEADTVLIATGRKPRTNGLGLDEAGIIHDSKGIPVDDNMQTNVEGIYAIGDVNGRMALAHAATCQGIRAVNHILNRTDNLRLDIMPAAIFTHPEAACVGLSEDKCKADNIEYTCRKGHYRSNGKAMADNCTEGIIKLLSTHDGRIIGCHAMGSHATDMVQEVTALMNCNATVSQLRDTIHIHPTLSEILQDTAGM